ncbi:MAG: thiamine pyrophosphate-dependent dehydrogenase E1 component subunit alpha [Verrucomicrobia bacterium]|nr:thiamine pyrophosphate-dependent dehydrogenase E1 component subunit alpha [Verrucomicrobiota bacterium]
MILARAVEDKLANLWRAGRVAGGVYTGKGQEAISAAVGMALRPGDLFGPAIRDQAGRLAFGEPLLDAVRTYLGSRLGPMRGREGNVHRGRVRDGTFAMISHLGSLISVVAGALLARRMRGEAHVVGAASAGDGATSTGAFHEGLNFAAVEKLPLVVVVTNNRYAYSTPNERQFACHDLVDRAIGYGVEGYTMDGTDVKECLEVVNHAVDRAREGRGPQMIVASCLRLSGHAEHDDASYVDPRVVAAPMAQDCIEIAKNYLLEQGWADIDAIRQWRESAKVQVEEAAARVQREPAPDPADEDWCAYATRRLGVSGR